MSHSKKPAAQETAPARLLIPRQDPQWNQPECCDRCNFLQYDNETNGFVGTRQVVRRMLTTDLANCWMKSSFREYLVKILGIGDPAVDPGCIDISFT